MSDTEEGEHLFSLVAGVARRASDGQLVVAAVVGIAGTAAIGLTRPSLWFLALVLLAVGAFGIWGIADRAATERAARLGPGFAGRQALAGVRLLAATAGTVAGLLVLLAAVATAIGTWRS